MQPRFSLNHLEGCQHQVGDFWDVEDCEKLLSMTSGNWRKGSWFLAQDHLVTTFLLNLFTCLPSLYVSHTSLRGKICSPRFKRFVGFVFRLKRGKGKNKKKEKCVTKMNASWVMLPKDTPERKPKPAASFLLQAVIIQGAEGEKRECVLSTPWPGTSKHVKTKHLNSLSAHRLHFPSHGCSCRRKTKLNFAVLQHKQAKALRQKPRDVASDSKLGPQAKFPQWSETWMSSADQEKTWQIDLKSSDSHFLSTDLAEKKSCSLFT